MFGLKSKDATQAVQDAQPLIDQLQREVANGFILYANYKHYHWQTYGPLFRDIHLMYDEFAEEVLATIDPIAERIRMMGHDVRTFQPSRMQTEASVQSAGDHQSLKEMVQEADANCLVVIRELRDAARMAEGINDPGTVDLLSKTVQVYEKQEWFLREHLKHRDGLTN